MGRYVRMIALLLGTAAGLGGCTVGHIILYNFASTKDYKKFPARPLPAAPVPFAYAVAAREQEPRTATWQEKTLPFDDFLRAHKTVAFLVIRRDTIVYERYFGGYDEAHMHTSFSAAKSVVSMLVGCAIADGYIQGVQQPVTDFIPELAKNGFAAVTIEELLQMTAGLKFDESYTNPFGDAAMFYYGRRMYRYMARMRLARTPGTHFEYQSGSTQLLGWVLERALRQHNDPRTVTEYLHDKLWSPLGMQFGGSWSIDRKKDGIEKFFCCLNAPARDYAKLGSLYLHQGNWQGRQLVPAEWVATSTKADTARGGVPYYRYQWWLPSPEGDFMAHGLLGQYIYVDPARELVIVRLGTKEGGFEWGGLLHSLAKAWP